MLIAGSFRGQSGIACLFTTTGHDMIAPTRNRLSRSFRRLDAAIPEFLCRTPLLAPSEENRLFRQIDELRQQDSEDSRRRVQHLRNRVVTANLRLLVSIAARFSAVDRTLSEVVSDGIASLIRAAELFNPARGNRFSTYASHAIWNHLARLRKRHAARRQREPSTSPEILSALATVEADSPRATTQRETLARRPEELLRPILSEREITLIAARFGLGDFTREHTFREVGRIVDLSRERVRILTHRALQKLREHLQIDAVDC